MLSSLRRDDHANFRGMRTTWGRTLGGVVLPGAETWAAKSLGVSSGGKLFIYTNDIVRGMDVLQYNGPLPPASEDRR